MLFGIYPEEGGQQMKSAEFYWRIISYAYAIADMAGMGCFFTRFARPFMERRHKAPCIGTVYFVTMSVFYFLPFEIENAVVYGIGVLVSFFVMCGIDKRNYRQKVFIAVTFFSLRWLSAYMTLEISLCLYQKIINTPYLIERQMLQLGCYIGAELFDLALRFLVMGVSVHSITKAYVYKRENMSVREMLMLAAPSAAGMTEYVMIRYYRGWFETNAGKEAPGIYSAVAFLHYGMSIITIVVVTVLFQNIRARQEERLQNELLAVQVDTLRRHIGQMEEHYRDIRSLRHDMTNHILTLERLYAGNKLQEAGAYSVDLKAVLAGMAGEIKSGNPVTDVILQEMKNEMEKRDIRFSTEFYFPEGSGVNAFDVSVILNNALQNAAEHAEESKEPQVAVRSYRRGNAYMIEVKNSFTGELRWDEETGLPLTTKESPEGHGYGLSNIRRVAEKYAGTIRIEGGDGEFCLSVLMMLEANVDK